MKKQILQITIYKNPSRGKLWYETYRFKDENILKNVNEKWYKINNDQTKINI